MMFAWKAPVEGLESTLNTDHEDCQTSVLAVNTYGGPIKLKQGVFLTETLVYDQKVLPETLEIPAACVASVHRSAGDIEKGTSPTLSSLQRRDCITRRLLGEHSQRSTLHQTQTTYTTCLYSRLPSSFIEGRTFPLECCPGTKFP